MNTSTWLYDKEDYIQTSLFSDDVHHNISSFLSKKPIKIGTSGSTGKPKIITIPYQNVIASIEGTVNTLELNKEHKALLCLNPNYIGGLMMVLRAIHTGMKLLVVDAASNPLTAISDKVDFVAMVPLQLEAILKDKSTKTLNILNAMKTLIIGGAPVNRELKDRIQQLQCPVYSTYGMTETVSHIALQRLNGAKASNTYNTIDGISIGVDQDSCLWIAGKVTGHQRIQTNDIVELINEEAFIWHGRRDNIINSGGIKIVPEKIESTISTLIEDTDTDFFVTGLPDNRLGQKLTLCLEGPFLGSTHMDNILKALKNIPEKYERPKDIIFIPSFTRTKNGKLMRQQTVSHYLKNLDK